MHTCSSAFCSSTSGTITVVAINGPSVKAAFLLLVLHSHCNHQHFIATAPCGQCIMSISKVNANFYAELNKHKRIITHLRRSKWSHPDCLTSWVSSRTAHVWLKSKSEKRQRLECLRAPLKMCLFTSSCRCGCHVAISCKAWSTVRERSNA